MTKISNVHSNGEAMRMFTLFFRNCLVHQSMSSMSVYSNVIPFLYVSSALIASIKSVQSGARCPAYGVWCKGKQLRLTYTEQTGETHCEVGNAACANRRFEGLCGEGIAGRWSVVYANVDFDPVDFRRSGRLGSLTSRKQPLKSLS